MFDVIKKIFSFLSALPAFSALFTKAATTGKIDPAEALQALTSISPSTKQLSDVAMNSVRNGGNIGDVAREIQDFGEVDVFGKKVDTRTMKEDLRKAGGACSILANILDNIPTQSAADIVDFGNQASDVNNWKELVNN